MAGEVGKKVNKITPPVWLYDGRAYIVQGITTAQKVVSYDPKRVALSFASGGVSAFSLWPTEILAGPAGFYLSSSHKDLRFHYNVNPWLTVQEWWATGPGLGGTLLIVEEFAVM